MTQKHTSTLTNTFRPNKWKVIITLAFLILLYCIGLLMTEKSTQCECMCPEGAEITYRGNTMLSDGQPCYRSIFIPFDDVYKHPNCCITLQNIILDNLLVVAASILLYVAYSVTQFIISRTRKYI